MIQRKPGRKGLIPQLRSLRTLGRGKLARAFLRKALPWMPLFALGDKELQETVIGLARTLQRKSVAKAKKTKGAMRAAEYTMLGMDTVTKWAGHGIFEAFYQALRLEDAITDALLPEPLEGILDVPEEWIREGVKGMQRIHDAFKEVSIATRKKRLQ